MIPVACGVLLALSINAVGISWMRFQSNTYPYAISQPSSYRHIVFKDASDRPVDYFFPSLGSYTTNVNIYAQSGTDIANERSYLRALGGQHIRDAGVVTIMGKPHRLMAADFRGLAGKWTIEQAVIVQQNRSWYLTMSYAKKYHGLRSVMLKMLRTFKAKH